MSRAILGCISSFGMSTPVFNSAATALSVALSDAAIAITL
jgi:hypothetical protein